MAASAAGATASSISAATPAGALSRASSETVEGLSTETATNDQMAFKTVIRKRPVMCILPRIDWDQVGITASTAVPTLNIFLAMTGVAVFSNLISTTEIEVLANEARALIDRPDVGNINFEWGAPTAYRRQCKLMAEDAQKKAPRTYEWSDRLLKKLQTHAMSVCTPAHKVEYIAIVENLKGRPTTAQLLHADRDLSGPLDDPESYSLVLHLPLTIEGQRLSMLMGSHNNIPVGSDPKAFVCHDMTEQTEGLIHYAHLIHAASAEPEGLGRLRLVINLSAKKPPPGPEKVQLYLIDGEHATAQPVTFAAAGAWEFGPKQDVRKKPKRRHQGGVMGDGAKRPPEQRQLQSRPQRGRAVDEDDGDAKSGVSPIIHNSSGIER